VTTLTADYRIFDLPWTAAAGEERRFRLLLAFGLLVFVVFMTVIALLPPVPRVAPAPLPQEVVKLVLAPPPPVVEPKPEEKPKPKPEVTVPKVQAPVDRTQQARKKAESSGLLAQKDLLKDLRDALDPSQMAPTKDLLAKVDGPSRADRSIIASQATATSGGINTAALSRGFGGGAGSLKGHETTQSVASFADSIAKGRPEAARTGSGGKAARSREEIETVFDRNKSAIFALYNRALRDNPGLQGKVVVELTIAPDGEVTACRIVSSELKDEDLERKLVSRIRLFRFEAKDVAPITTTKPIDFFPA
jgi:periplasmic protein TonB